jgi:hypothetical protein
MLTGVSERAAPVQKQGSLRISQHNGSVARMPTAVLAAIGRRALGTVNGRRTVIIREGAGLEARPVIVEVADFVRQPVVRPNMVDANMVDPELRRQARRYGQRGQKGGGRKELQAGHLGFSEWAKGRHLKPKAVPI